LPTPSAEVPRRIVAALRTGLSVDPNLRPSEVETISAQFHLERSGRSRFLIALAAATVAVAGGAVAWQGLHNSPSENACGIAPVQFSSVPRAADDAALPMIKHLRELLDKSASTETMARVSICRATRIDRTQSDAAHDARMRCANDLHNQIEALLKQTAKADNIALGQLNDAIAQQPQAQECVNASGGASPRTRAAQVAVDALVARMQLLRAKFAQNQFPVDAAQQIVIEASALSDAETIARAALTAAMAYRGTAAYEKADASSLLAITTAEQAGLVELAAEAWVVRLSIAGERADYRAAKLWLPLANVAVNKLRDNPRITARFENDVGLLSLSDNDLGAAKSHLDRALQLRIALYGDAANADVARTLSALGHHARLTGDFSKAIALHSKALKFDRTALGEHHRDVGRDLHNLAGVMRLAGDIDGANKLYTEALALRTAALGAAHPLVGLTNNSLGLIAMEQGRLADAEQFFTTAKVILQAADNNDWAIPVENLGRIELERKNGTAAETILREAVALYRRQYVGPHARVASTLLALLSAALMQNNVKSANDLLTQVDAALPDDAALLQERNNLAAQLRARQELLANRHKTKPPGDARVVTVTEPTDAKADVKVLKLSEPLVLPPEPIVAPRAHPFTYGSSSGWE
jgi:tetratricopeptide (TPR) repeat protein